MIGTDRVRLVAILAASLFALVSGVVATRLVNVQTADTPRYQRLAENLSTRGVFSSCPHPPLHPELQRVPGYPVFLMVLQRLGIGYDSGISCAQALLHALAVLAVAGLAPRYPVAVAWAFALYPNSLILSIRLMSEGLSEFLLVTGLLLCARSSRPTAQRTTLLALGGLILSALSLTRPIYLFFPAALALGGVVIRRFGVSGAWSRRDLLVVFLCGTLPVVPWVVRTSRIAGRPMPLALNFLGPNLWLATWEYRVSYHDLEYRLFQPDDPRNQGVSMDLNECDPAKNLKESDHARHIARRRILDNPGAYLLESVWRSIRVWLTWEITEPTSQCVRWVSPFLRYTSILILGLGLIGAWLLRRQPIPILTLIIPCLYLSILHMPLHISGRYTHPARGLLIALAVYALGAFLSSKRQDSPTPERV
jgi:hypothetical protein